MQPSSQASLPGKNISPQSRILLIGCIIALVSASTIIFFSFRLFTTLDRPGGEWISPVNGATVHDIMRVAMYAYPAQDGEPAIAYVNVTLAWEGSDPHQWFIACHLTMPIRIDIFQCDVQIRQLGVPAGRVRVSFDVYDQVGNIHDAPNGTHDVVYVPTGYTPTP